VSVYVHKFFSSTNIVIYPTQYGILLEESGSESYCTDDLEPKNELLVAELLKICAVGMECLDAKIDDVSDEE
jgi:hypothetical protein